VTTSSGVSGHRCWNGQMGFQPSMLFNILSGRICDIINNYCWSYLRILPFELQRSWNYMGVERSCVPMQHDVCSGITKTTQSMEILSFCDYDLLYAHSGSNSLWTEWGKLCIKDLDHELNPRLPVLTWIRPSGSIWNINISGLDPTLRQHVKPW
jgi:hypothetical protein